MSRRIPHVEGLPGDAEDIGGSALEHDQVAIVGARNNHFDAGLCPVQGQESPPVFPRLPRGMFRRPTTPAEYFRATPPPMGRGVLFGIAILFS